MSAKAHQKCTREYQREYRRKLGNAYEAYEGKRALLRMYEEQGIHDEYTGELRKRVAKMKVLLLNRGAL